MEAKEFTITRTFDAPREAVWRAWTEPALAAQWWHPHEVVTPPDSVRIDARVGRRYEYLMIAPDGSYAERHAPLPVTEQYRLTAHDRIPALEAPAETDENGVAAPGGRKAKLRHKVRSFYYHGAVDKPTAHEVEHAEEHLAELDGHPVPLGEDFQGVSETGIPKSH